MDPVARARGRTTAWRLAGVAAGLGAALAVLSLPSWTLGLGSALAAPAFALCLLAGVIIGEVFGRAAPSGITRTATIEVRSAWAFLPRRLGIAVVATAGVLAALLVTTTVVASPDDMGRAGRAFAVACGPYVHPMATPWPGAFYSVPIGVAVLIGVIMAAVAVRAVTSRPRPRSDVRGRRADDEIRRTSGRAITAAFGVLVATPLAGSALFAGRALQTVPCTSTAVRLVGLATLVLAAAAAVASAWFAAGALLPTGREHP